MNLFVLVMLVCFLTDTNTKDANAEVVYRFGVTVESNIKDSSGNSYNKTLVDYLRQQTGLKFQIVVPRDYEEMSERITNHTLDFASLTAVNYVKTRQVNQDMKYIATATMDIAGSILPYYLAAIVTRFDSAINTVDDLRGKRFGFSYRSSSSGHAFPRLILDQHNISIDSDLASYAFVGTYSKLFRALAKGAVDAIGAPDPIVSRYAKKLGVRLKVIARSKPISMAAIVASPKVAPDVISKVTSALLALEKHKSVIEILRKTIPMQAGYGVYDETLFDSTLEALKYLEPDNS